MKVFIAGAESRHWLHDILSDKKTMRIFLAGGISGNLKPFWHRVSDKIGPDCQIKETMRDEMKVFLAGQAPWKNEGIYDEIIENYKPYILESFYYADSDTERLLPLFGDFLLDSGAFTFMQNSKARVDWDAYIEEYANFVKRNKIQKYFELDIDSVVGYEKVLRYRKRLESLVGRPCIPVWHVSRGIDEFKKMCDEYSYAAIGGIVSKEIRPDKYEIFPAMISEAHKRKCKLHGLGFTALQYLPKCHFDSVDSTAWTTGNRFGYVYKFKNGKMTKIDCPEGKRLADGRQIALINYTEWIKYQKYAEVYL